MQIKFISPTSSQPPSLLRKALALILMLALATVALIFSTILLAAILVIAIVGGVYLWWKTRELRKVMRNFTPPPSATRQSDAFAGEVVEGEVIVVEKSRVERQ